MNALKSIRELLQVTQAEIAVAIGVTQGNVSFYERGVQDIPARVAARLIEFAQARGVALTYDHVYGASELPPPVLQPDTTTSAAA